MLREILNAGKTGIAPDLHTLAEGRYFFRSVGDEEKELTGALPLRFRSSGNDLIDWKITGAEGGIGKPGVNYLKMEEKTVSDGGDGTIKYIFSDYPIPPESPRTSEYAQWARPNYSRNYKVGEYFVVIDERIPGYDNCIWFANLKAGKYKLITEFYNGDARPGEYGDNLWYLLNSPYGAPNKFPYVSLFKPGEEEPLLTVKILDDFKGPYYEHKEFPFEIDEDMKIGLFGVFPNSCRFMIVDEDVEAKPFSDGGRYTDVTSWEPFHYVLPLTINCGGKSETVTIDLGQNPLGAGESISLADRGITIPTYRGLNTIDSDAYINPPEMYIKYRG